MDTSAGTAVHRFDRRRLENRERIQTAAEELFREKGRRATTVAEICRRAAVARRTFFNHFETADHLVRALARRNALRFEQFIDAARRERGAGTETLQWILDLMAEHLESTGAMSREIVGEMIHVTAAADGDEAIQTGVLHGAFRRLVEEGARRGSVTRRHRPAVLADIVVGTVTVVLSNWARLPEYDLRVGLRAAGVALADLLDARRDPGRARLRRVVAVGRG